MGGALPRVPPARPVPRGCTRDPSWDSSRDPSRHPSRRQALTGPAALAARAALPLPARRVSLSAALPEARQPPGPTERLGRRRWCCLSLSSAGSLFARDTAAGRGAAAAAAGRAGPAGMQLRGGKRGPGRGHGGVPGVLQAQRVGGRAAAPGGGPRVPPSGVPGRRGALRDGPRSVPGGPACGPAHARVSRGAPDAPPALRGVRPSEAAPRLWASPGQGTAAGDRLRELGGHGGTGAMQGSAPRPALRRGT